MSTLDYKSILSLAEKKQQMKDNEYLVKRKSKGGQGSGPDPSSIAAFKARKEREELQKMKERQREKERLMALRAQNSKSVKKAKMMKTRTKDNDFSGLLTDAQAEDQRKVEEKLRLKGTQDLLRNKKAMIESEDKLIRNGNKNLNNFNSNIDLKKKAISCDKSGHKKNISEGNENREKARKPTPKPMSYDALLSLASEKAKTEKKSLVDEIQAEIKEKKQTRPMTQKEKDKLKEEMYYRQRAEKGMAKLPDPETIRKNKTKEPKNDNSSNLKRDIDPNSKYGNNKLIAKTVVPNAQQKTNVCDKNMKPNDNSSRLPSDKQRPIPQVMARQEPKKAPQSKAMTKADIMNKMNNRLNSRDKEYNERYSNASKERQRLESQVRAPNQKINQRARPPSPPIRPPMPKLPPIGSTYKRGMYEDPSQYMVEEDNYEEEEEDEDMADFIDDGPEEIPEEEDYSKAIREIFGYDKRKYRGVIEDDDDIEETNFSRIMQEEARSARIGLMEDLEEERKEEEHKRRKMMAKRRRIEDD